MRKGKLNTRQIKTLTVRIAQEESELKRQIGIFCIHRGKTGVRIPEVADHCNIATGKAKTTLDGMLDGGLVDRFKRRYAANRRTEEEYGDAYLEIVERAGGLQPVETAPKSNGQY